MATEAFICFSLEVCVTALGFCCGFLLFYVAIEYNEILYGCHDGHVSLIEEIFDLHETLWFNKYKNTKLYWEFGAN